MYKEFGAQELPAPMPPLPKKKEDRPPYVEFGNAEKFNQKIIKPWHELKPAIGDFDDIYAQWNLMKLCFPYLKESNGAIINFTSGVYQVGFAMMAAYVADKAAIRGLSMVAAREWGPAGIRVNTISPVAMTDTIMDNLPPGFKKIILKEAKKNCFHKLGDPVRDINPVVAFLCSDDSQWITGQNINVDGGTVVSI